ncbi:VCBS repeat-containing protein [Myxococcota bacterium]|nr:VCBS repeat-containing protein [Myxococcota bacterium]
MDLLLRMVVLLYVLGCGDADGPDAADGGGADGGGADGGGADGGTVDAADVDDDGDGWTERQGDCVDDDPAVLPGAATFTAIHSGFWVQELGAETSEPTLGDLDGDAVLDLVFTIPGEASLQVWLGRGDGTFAWSTTFSPPVAPGVSVVADLDGDGLADLAWANGAGDVVVHLGVGAGALDGSGIATRSGCPSVLDLAAADLDGDGAVDLVAGCDGLDALALWGDGSGTFTPETLPARGYELVVHDLDGDADLDIALGGGTSLLTLLLHEGGRDFTARSEVLAGVGTSLAGADIDADGDVDLVAAVGSSNSLEVWSNDGAGGLSFGLSGGPDDFDGSNYYDLVAVDVDGDGDQDVAARVGSGSYLFRADGGALAYDGWTSGQSWGGTLSALAAGDVDGDGRDDLALTTREETWVAVARGQDDGAFGDAI